MQNLLKNIVHNTMLENHNLCRGEKHYYYLKKDKIFVCIG
jgi:hypothetical protein